MAMVELTVARLGFDSSTSAYVVILQERDGARLLPIWIGEPEARSILAQMKQSRSERPMTHDLCKSLITGLGASLRRVQITKVEKNTYFAELHVVRDDRLVQVDARPSDAIAVALRLAAPVFAAESLLSDPAGGDEEEGESEPPPPSGPGEGEGMSSEELKEYLERMRPEDFGKFSL